MASVFAVSLALLSMGLRAIAAIDANTQRNINIVEFEMKMLHQTIMKKYAALSKLRGCATTIKTFYNGSNLQEDNIGTDPFVKTLSEIKKYTELEKHLYTAIIQKMKVLFPSDIPLNDEGTYRESLRSLSKPLDAMKERDNEHMSPQQCGILEFKDSFKRSPTLIRKFPACRRIRCNIADLTVLQDGSLVFVDWGRRRIKRISQTGRGRAKFKLRLDFRPSSVAYFKPNKVLIETVPRRERIFNILDLETGEYELRYSIYRGDVSYNTVVIEGRVIVGGKYGAGMHVFSDQRLIRRIFSHITNYDQYHSLIPLDAENGSPFFLLTGTMLKGDMVLTGATGERLCIVRRPHRSRGVVRKNGEFMLIGETIDRTVFVKWYNKECRCIGNHILHKLKPVTNIALVNNTLITTSHEDVFHIYSI